MVELISEGEQIVNDVKNDSEHVSSCHALHEFIDEKFHTILSNKIKSEVKLALNELINHDFIQNIQHNNNSSNGFNLKENKSMDDLISTLKEEIDFLRNEVVSKDKIIELMRKDKCDAHTEKNVNFVGKSSMTISESIANIDNTINDKNDKKKRRCWT